MKKANLRKTKHGLAPSGAGWFVLNAAKAAWFANEKFGACCVFEGKGAARFSQYGLNIHVLAPGQPNCFYHAESEQENFLVLAGECVLIIEGKEKRLRAWDFVHCPAGTEHVFVGAGKKPCAILMAGARRKGSKVRYPVSRKALRRGAGVSKETSEPKRAYAACPPWKPVPGKRLAGK